MQRPWVAPLVLALVTGTVYLVTQAPGLYYTDTGELAAAASVWGVAHPTGYPLFTLLAHVWTLLPWPSAIAGLNILGALLVGASTAVVAACIDSLLQRIAPEGSHSSRRILGIVGAGLFAFAATTWAQTTAIEVYGLQILLMACTLLFTLRASGNSARWTVMAGLFFGLMLANHLSSIFLAPGLLIVWWSGQGAAQRARRHLPWLLIPSLLGPTLYALLPLRSATQPPINWGMVHRGWEFFLYHVQGTQFSVWMFSDTVAMQDNARLFLQLASAELLWLGWLAVAIGGVLMFRSARAATVGLVVIVAGNLAISLGYAIPDIDAYFLPSLLILSVLAAIGLLPLVNRLSPRLRPTLLAIPLIALGMNVSTMDHREHTAVRDYTLWTLANVEPNAIVITRQWDYLCSAFWYLQTVELVRTDVAMIEKELLRRTWYTPYLQQRYPAVMDRVADAVAAYQPWLERFEHDADAFMANKRNPAEIQRRFVNLLNAIVDANPDRPVYLTPELLGEEQGFAAGYQAVPVGPLFRLTTDTAALPPPDMQHVLALAQSLNGRSSRLDEGLRSTVINALATNALYGSQIRGELNTYRTVLPVLKILDPSGRTYRSLQQRVQQ